MTINEVITFCNTIAAEHGFTIPCPIRENGRLTTTLGRVTFRGSELISIEFSKRHLTSATEESIKETILHELAHAFVVLETGESHGHDKVFKAMCARLGTTNDGCRHNNLQMTKEESELYKYSIFCGCCGKWIGGRQRACSVTQDSSRYQSNCCKAKLNIIQNW